MASKSRRKGVEFEREIVNAFKSVGINAERRSTLQANSANEDQGDVFAPGIGRVECKRRARGFSLIYAAVQNADCAVIRDDRRRPLIVFELEKWLNRDKK